MSYIYYVTYSMYVLINDSLNNNNSKKMLKCLYSGEESYLSFSLPFPPLSTSSQILLTNLTAPAVLSRLKSSSEQRVA